jgi:DNA-3-methyladenine glycosylase II
LRADSLSENGHIGDTSVRESFDFSALAKPPFRLDFTAWALRRRPGNIVDRFDDNVYRRALVLGDRPVEIAVTQPEQSEALVEVTVYGVAHSPEAKSLVMDFLERTLGIRRELSGFYALPVRNEEMGRIFSRFRGLKPVRFPSVFEALVNGIACQQISLAAGLAILNRLTERAGLTLSPREILERGVVHAFPRPADMVRLDAEDLREIGFSRQKAMFLVELSKAVIGEEIDFESLEGLDNGKAMELLRGIRGVGRWTGEYALLRGLGRLDIFPGDDSGVRKKLMGVLDLQGPLSYEKTIEAVQGWQPYAGLVYLHLLLADLASRGYIDNG